MGAASSLDFSRKVSQPFQKFEKVWSRFKALPKW